ncbi:Biogenesis of lysosome-related organelles complex 1 subunit 1 [Araneus ventricosus]|uniref:Biogenesis of lysosome-related organelles complex 1 subunit 1 n=2 Tax=Araneus ventricosus TaxID=182803 RepID=A0A4Y2QCA6_ARAVE|nr:Biogenesis of lysosome-related organelles complex 1 subunit 1 [Araneus ventricosus]GBN60862.1 Biogenesis of lysosome-related organelles complex 1 subunit 1 [Araneus ventricosus]
MDKLKLLEVNSHIDKELLISSVAQAYLNQKRLDYESKQLHANVTNFAKQTAQWLQLVENFSQVLKEIGDVENWARSIENDMSTISSALEYAYKVGQET